MIDEDLYQLAADELNTDKRRPHVWARACALASDDHDEARYLYTNLRVEELIAERAAAEQSSTDSDTDEADASLALEPLDFDDASDEEAPVSISTPSGIDQSASSHDDDALSLASDDLSEIESEFDAVQSRNFEESFDAGFDHDENEAEPRQDAADDFLDETINLTSELDGTAVFELDNSDLPDADDTQGGENTPELSADEELEALLGGVYEAGAPVTASDDNDSTAMTADFSDVSGSHPAMDDDLSWLDEKSLSDDDSIETESDNENQLITLSGGDDDDLTLDDFRDTDKLARELERQAEEITGLPSDVVATSEQTVDDQALPFDTAATSEQSADEQALAGETVAPSEQPADEHAVASDEEQLALVLDQESAGEETGDSTGSTGLDSIFDSIEHDADKAVSGKTQNTTEADSPAAADASKPADPALDTNADSDAADDQFRHSGDQSERDEHLPAAAMAAAGAAAIGAATSSSDAAQPIPTRRVQAGAVQSSASVGADAASTTGAARSLSGGDLPLDLSAARSKGALYSVLRRDTQTQAVKRGGSWSALFLTLPFLIYRHQFGTAVVYLIMWLILVGGLLISGLAWLDAGSAASLAIKASTIGFGVLAFIGLLYLPFRHANQWREDKLEQRGFEPLALVRDTSPGKAISQARKATTRD